MLEVLAPFEGISFVSVGGMLPFVLVEREVSGCCSFGARTVDDGGTATTAASAVAALLVLNDGTVGKAGWIPNPRGMFPSVFPGSMEIVSKIFSLGFHLRGDSLRGDDGEFVPFDALTLASFVFGEVVGR